MGELLIVYSRNLFIPLMVEYQISFCAVKFTWTRKLPPILQQLASYFLVKKILLFWEKFVVDGQGKAKLTTVSVISTLPQRQFPSNPWNRSWHPLKIDSCLPARTPCSDVTGTPWRMSESSLIETDFRLPPPTIIIPAADACNYQEQLWSLNISLITTIYNCDSALPNEESKKKEKKISHREFYENCVNSLMKDKFWSHAFQKRLLVTDPSSTHCHTIVF